MKRRLPNTPTEIAVPLVARAAEVRAASFNETDNTIDIVWTTGAKVRRYSWSEGPYDEELVVTPGAVRLDRLNAGAPFLNTHSASDLSFVIGSVVPGTARIEGGKGLATIVLTSREDAQGVVKDIRDGVIRNISVGYRYHKVEKTDGQEGDPALWRVTDWEPLEVSAVPIPADPGAQIRSGAPASGFSCAITDLTHAAFRTDSSVAQTRMRMLAAEAASRATSTPPLPLTDPKGPPTVTHIPAQPRRDDDRSRAEAVTSALLHRTAPDQFTLPDAAREFAGMTLTEIARSTLEAQGLSTRSLSRSEIVDLATANGTRTGGSHSTSDFPSILANVATKTLRAAYEAAPQTFRPLVREVSVPDFRTVTRGQIGEAPQLERINEHGEYKRGTMGEGSESYAIATYGKVIALTRQAIINDDLGAFARLSRAFGVSAANLESDLVWAQILMNPTMGDGVALFHASHNNLGSAAGINADSVAAGFEAMRLQKGLDGKTLLNLTPRFLITSAAAVMKGAQLLAPLQAAQAADTVPAYLRVVTPISEPRLDTGFTDPASGTVIAGNRFAWYLGADPAQIDTVELAYLEGQRGVYTETQRGFNIDGVEVKARLDAGAKVIDWRAFWKNPAVAL